MPTTPSRGYEFPDVDEAAAGPYAMEQLALSVEGDVDVQVGRIVDLEVFQSSLRVGTIGLLTTNDNGDGSFAVPGGGYPTALTACVLTDATAITGLGMIVVKWTSASSTKDIVTFRVYDAAGATVRNITTATNMAFGYMLVGN
jgi:hypothetical protein